MEMKKTIHHKSSSSNSLHNPSFSSSLLDSIYRSIDDEEGGGVRAPEEMASCKGLTQTLAGSRSRAFCSSLEKDEEDDVKVDSFRRVVEKWMADKRRSSERSASATAGRKSSSAPAVLSSSNSNSSSSSSDSSFWSGSLSMSESESFHCPKSTCSSASSCYSKQRPKPIRTERDSNSSSSQKPKKHHDHGEAIGKTKSKALKIYTELKKAKSKQPISPGGKLASFLNTLFANTKKKPKIVLEPSRGACDESARVKYSKSNSIPSSCPSSASSYSRSCLSKTPSSKMSTGNGTKRSVRFDPVSVIVDGDSQPCGHKNLREEDDLNTYVMEENRKVAEAARKLLESYQMMKAGYNLKGSNDDLHGDEDDENDDDDDDRESCSSSDLFELDNLSAIGVERYREELPVYETTHVSTNRAIASGLIL